jgi:hypothetical protein
MARPRKIPSEITIKEKASLIQDARALAEIAAEDSESGLKIKQLLFCRLIAEGGFDQKQAYIEAYQPNPDKVTDRSIIDMSSRLARKPEVKHEIERIQTDLQEEAMSRQTRLMFALDSRKVNERILIELYAMATSASADSKTKLRAIELLGKTRSVDAFVSSTSINNTAMINGNLGIDSTGSVSKAKEMLAANVKKMIEARQPEVIEVKS